MKSKILPILLLAVACAFHAEAARTNVINGGVVIYTNVSSYIVITTNAVTNSVLQLSAQPSTNAALLGSKVTTNAFYDRLTLGDGSSLTNLSIASTNAIFNELAIANGTSLTNLSIANKVTTNAVFDQLAVANGTALTNLSIANKVTTNAVLDQLGVANGASLTNIPLAGVTGTAAKLTTNAANIGFIVDASGTNLLWIANGITNFITKTPL